MTMKAQKTITEKDTIDNIEKDSRPFNCDSDDNKEKMTTKDIQALSAMAEAKTIQNYDLPLNEDKKRDEYILLTSFSADECTDRIENLRNEYVAKVNKYSKRKIVCYAIIAMALIGALISLFFSPGDYKWISFIILGAWIIMSLFFVNGLSSAKKKLLDAYDGYIGKVLVIEDGYLFSQKDIINQSVYVSGKVSLEDIKEAHYFDVIYSFSSRNLIKSRFLDRELICGDVLCMTPFKGKIPDQEMAKRSGMRGKYFMYPLGLRNGEGIIIFMCKKDGNKPSYLDGYHNKIVEGLDKTFEVYATDEEVSGEFFSDSDIIQTLNNYVTSTLIESMFVSINGAGLKVSLNYPKTANEVPLKERADKSVYTNLHADVGLTVELIRALNK